MQQNDLLKIMQENSVCTGYWHHQDYISWKSAALPVCEGKTVLDVGCHEGYYSFLAEQRGAKQVLSVDFSDMYFSSFLSVKQKINSECELREVDVYNLDNVEGSFDLVFFLDVYYHIDDPLRALKALRKKTKGVLVFGGYVIESEFIDTDKPVMYMFHPGELYGDTTNVWGATKSCLVRMLAAAGFHVFNTIDKWTARTIMWAS